MKKRLPFIIFLLGLYFFSSGSSYAVFKFITSGGSSVLQSPLSSENTPTGVQGRFPTPPGPKNEICPLNGAKFTETEKTTWEARRPLLVMIENHEDARPQSGLSKADIVYEAVAEGAITRFMAVFYCGTAAYSYEGDYDVGPVRSARTYFVDCLRIRRLSPVRPCRRL